MVHDVTYPGVAEDFGETFRRLRDLDVGIWVAVHASHWRLHDKYDPAATYSAEAFVDTAGYRSAVERCETALRRLVEAEKSRV